MATNINFSVIRPYKGDQRKGFEELCCQLYSLEPPGADAKFVRKGGAGDAGVECYWILKDGSEHGLQAKYFTRFADEHWPQVDDSVLTTLLKHPKLTKYIICIPDNLRDRRATLKSGKKEKSQQESWDEHVIKWKNLARKKGMGVEYVLWNEFELTKRLTNENPQWSGRAFYWFNKHILSPEWFRRKFEISRDDLHDRYTPEHNVELSLAELFHALAWDEFYKDKFICHQESTNRAIEDFSSAASKNIFLSIQATVDNACEHARKAGVISNSVYKKLPDAPTVKLFLEELESVISVLEKARKSILDVPSAPDEKSGQERRKEIDYALMRLRGVISAVSSLKGTLNSKYFQSAIAQAALVLGEAGTGKSHLLCRAADEFSSKENPAIFILGHYFREGNPWDQFLSRLDLRDCSVEEFLGALDSAGQSSGTRTLIIIDAINEGDTHSIWRDNLAGFLRQASQFPRIAVVISCRSIYEKRLVPLAIGPEVLVRFEHKGFLGHEDAAAVAYLDKRGIDRPSSPIPSPEFSNPLFLKTISDALVKRGEKSFPKGMTGISRVFEFYAESLDQNLARRLSIDTGNPIAIRALKSIAGKMATEGVEWITKMSALATLKRFMPKHEDDLLSALILEGALVDDIRYKTEKDEEDIGTDIIKFTYQRFSDYFISKKMLENNLKISNPKESFKKGSKLFSFIASDKRYTAPGVLETMSIQVPEMCGRELIALLPKEIQADWTIMKSFMGSILWRRPNCITKETIRWFNEVGGVSGDDSREKTLLRVATEPEHGFNADFLHANLIKKPMPQRDSTWSVALTRMYGDDDSAADILINWAWEGSLATIEDKRAELCGTALTWLFTTSHRMVRDRATKALAKLLVDRLYIAKRLLEKFERVDDLYLKERLYAAIYGAVLNSVDTKGFQELVNLLYEKEFSHGFPTPHILLRDYARGIIEFADHVKCLPPHIDMKKIRPPYTSPWPLQIPSKNDMGIYSETRDAIYFSTHHDDFNNYTINPVCEWSITPLSKKELIKSESIYNHFVKRLKASRNKKLIILFLKYDKSQTIVKDEGNEKDSLSRFLRALSNEKLRGILEKERKAEEKLEKKIIALLSKGQSNVFRSVIKSHIAHVSNRQDKSGFVLRVAKEDAARWICKRAHDLGWKKELFESAERGMQGRVDRSRPIVERIGKKYQYLAFHELLARLSDNVHMTREYSNDEIQKYDGPWQISERDVDPSIFIRKTKYNGWADHGKSTWWKPKKIILGESEVESRIKWLWDKKEDIPTIEDQLFVQEPKKGEHWVLLDSFWKTSERGDGTSGNTLGVREFWLRIQSALLRRSDLPTLLLHLDNKNLCPGDEFKAQKVYGAFYLSEYPWHPAAGTVPKQWQKADGCGHWSLPVDRLVMNTECALEKGERDLAVEEGITIRMPSPWLMNKLGLYLVNKESIQYMNHQNKKIYFDPSIIEEGPSASLMHLTTLRDLVEKDKLVVVWAIGGEKTVYQPLFYGRNCYSGVYYWDGRTVKGKTWVFESRLDEPKKL